MSSGLSVERDGRGKERREGGQEGERERKGDHIKVREFIITTLQVFMVFHMET